MQAIVNLDNAELNGLNWNLRYDLPEVTAKKYAEMSGASPRLIVQMCEVGFKNGGLPARKLTAKGEVVNLDDKGTWWVNLVKLREALQ